jgi:hypothetical protein
VKFCCGGCLLALFLAPALPAQPLEDLPGAGGEKVFSTLADFPFEGESRPTGPDTFAVFAKESGQVSRTYHFRAAGEMALEIRDRAGDQAFPELQGYFEIRRRGEIFCHFAFLVTTPEESFNIALAGPAYFVLAKDGIAFWLENRGGHLVHWSDSIPKKLFALQGFTWYSVDLRYRLKPGTYDLAIRQEGLETPLVELLEQPNAAALPGSAIDKFSFIGDRGEDTSNVVYYVDDLRIEAGEKLPERTFAAPGRRNLFVDMNGKPGDEEEAEADRLLREGNPLAARDLYLGLLGRREGASWTHLWLKLADAYWLLGDVENERRIRETFFGSLN